MRPCINKVLNAHIECSINILYQIDFRQHNSRKIIEMKYYCKCDSHYAIARAHSKSSSSAQHTNTHTSHRRPCICKLACCRRMYCYYDIPLLHYNTNWPTFTYEYMCTLWQHTHTIRLYPKYIYLLYILLFDGMVTAHICCWNLCLFISGK